MLTELKKIAADFEAQPLSRGGEMRELLEHSPQEFCAAAVEILSGADPERVKRYLVALLWTNRLLIPCLTDPTTPAKKAEDIAALARRVDPQLPAKLVGFLLERTDLEPPECLERILGILKFMPDATSFRPLLTPLLRHGNARIRSKVALLAGEGNRNRTWFERRMLEDDPRVRANAIESAGTAVAEDLRPLFRSAALDSNNRVVGNALIALYRLGEAEAVGGLHELAFRQDPAFRATAVWAMGETGDSRFLPVVARILTDPHETTKAAAFRAIRKLRGQEKPQGQPFDVRLLAEPSLDGSTLKVVFSVSDHGKPVPGIAATAVQILVNGEFIYRYSVTEQECRRRITAAFFLPRAVPQQRERMERHRQALENCFGQRQFGDAWMLSYHSESANSSGAGRAETLFGVRIDSANEGNTRLVTDLSELRTATDASGQVKRTGFMAGFLELCQELRLSRVSAHLFLLNPEVAQAVEPATLIRVAQESRVTVHAICSPPVGGFREICQATNGFYIVGDIPQTLPALYCGISHRYHANLTPDMEVRQIQVAVRSGDFFGESRVLEMG